jgi:hypothetical protein
MRLATWPGEATLHPVRRRDRADPVGRSQLLPGWSTCLFTVSEPHLFARE